MVVIKPTTCTLFTSAEIELIKYCCGTKVTDQIHPYDLSVSFAPAFYPNLLSAADVCGVSSRPLVTSPGLIIARVSVILLLVDKTCLCFSSSNQ